MFKKAYSILEDYGLAEDAVHNAFLRIIKYLPKLYEPNHPKTMWYVIVVAENEAKTIYNREHLIIEPDLLNTNEPEVQNYVEKLDEVQRLKRIIGELPDIYKEVLTLRYFNELTPKEISKALSLPVSSVYKRIERGKILLLKQFNEEYEDD